MPPRVQPKTFTLTFKTHKLTVLTTVTQPEKTTIGDLKIEALSALQADVLSADRDEDVDMLYGAAAPDPEWTPPMVESVDDFELCRAIRERGRPTGQYETLLTKDVVKQTVANWESLFIQFRENGKLVPVKVSIPALVEEDDEEPDYSTAQKGKRKAAPTDDSEP